MKKLFKAIMNFFRELFLGVKQASVEKAEIKTEEKSRASMTYGTNSPYVKKYNSKKELLNPITKGKPYLNNAPTTLQKRREEKLKRRNKMNQDNPDNSLYLRLKQAGKLADSSQSFKKWIKERNEKLNYMNEQIQLRAKTRMMFILNKNLKA